MEAREQPPGMMDGGENRRRSRDSTARAVSDDPDFGELPVHFQQLQANIKNTFVPSMPIVSQSAASLPLPPHCKPQLTDASTQYFDLGPTLTPAPTYPARSQGKVDSGCQYSPNDIDHLFPMAATLATSALYGIAPNGYFDNTKAGKAGLSAAGMMSGVGGGGGGGGSASNARSASHHGGVQQNGGASSTAPAVVKPYRCPECNVSFTRVDHLSRHLKTQRSHFHSAMNGEASSGAPMPRPYWCPECNVSFTRVDHLSRHLKTQRSHVQSAMRDKNLGGGSDSSGGAQYHPCPHCSKLFTRRDHMKRHSKIHARGEPVKCVECLMWFPTAGQLNWHLLQAHNIQVYECTYCAKGFSQAQFLTRHLKEKHLIVDGVKLDPSGALNPLQNEALHLPYRCGICSLNFSREAECSEHMVLHSGQDSGPASSSSSSSQPYSAASQNAGSSSVAGSRSQAGMWPGLYSQGEKDMLYSRSNMLGSPPFSPHSQPLLGNGVTPPAFPYPTMGLSGSGLKAEGFQVAGVCVKKAAAGNSSISGQGKSGSKAVSVGTVTTFGNTFPSFPNASLRPGQSASGSQKSSKGRHQQQQAQPFMCGVCGMGFARSPELKMHLRRHVGYRPYACSECGSSFGSSSNLVRHQRSHSGERPYKCDQCPGAFTHKGALVNHERIHTGQRPYECELCGAAFARCDALSRHRKTHKENRLKQEMDSAPEGGLITLHH